MKYDSKKGLYYDPAKNKYVYAEKLGVEDYGQVIAEFNTIEEFHKYLEE